MLAKNGKKGVVFSRELCTEYRKKGTDIEIFNWSFLFFEKYPNKELNSKLNLVTIIFLFP